MRDKTGEFYVLPFIFHIQFTFCSAVCRFRPLSRSAGAGDFACTARQERATSPVPLGRSGRLRLYRSAGVGDFACTARQEWAGFSRVCNQPFSATSLRESDFGGIEPPKSRGTLPKILSRGIFGSVPLQLRSFDCSAAVKGGFLLNLQSRFRWLKPTQTLGENSCFPLKPFSALWRIAALRAESAASPRVAPAGLRTFF